MSEEENKPHTPPTENSGNGDSELQKALDQAEKYKNDFLYLRAEFENYKRNAIKERSDMMKYGSERFIRDFLEIVDNFERALETKVTAENFQTFRQGVEMTAHELKNLLQKHSVSEVPSAGAAFDPTVHEALGSEPSQEVEPGYITKVFKKPYKLHDKVIRTGQVVVAVKPN